VYVPGNETAGWDDQESRKRRQKAREGAMYAGVVSVIDHRKQILNVDFEDGDKAIGVPFNLVKFPDGQFFDEAMSMEHRRSSASLSQMAVPCLHSQSVVFCQMNIPLSVIRVGNIIHCHTIVMGTANP